MFGKNEKRADLEAFCIYDSKTKAYGTPQFALNHHDLVRQIINMFQEPEQQLKNQLYLNAEDFSLFRLGTYDKSTGKLDLSGLEHIANFNDLRALVQPKHPSPQSQAQQIWDHPRTQS